MSGLERIKISVGTKGKALQKLLPKSNKLGTISDVNRDHDGQLKNLATVSKEEAKKNKVHEERMTCEEKHTKDKDSIRNDNDLLNEIQAKKASGSAEVINDLNEMLRCKELEIDRYKNQLEALEKTVSSLKKDNNELRRENELLRKKRIEEHHYRKKKEATQPDHNIPEEASLLAHSTWYPLEDRIEKSKEEKCEMAKVLNDANDTIKRRDEAISRCESEMKELRKQFLETNNNRADPQTIQRLQNQIHTLTLRLSELASARLLQNNPNIADLGDVDRPTKLAERFSELYDNEWTEAFDELCELRGLDETAGINYMLDLLQKSYNECTTYLKPITDFLQSLATVKIVYSKFNSGDVDLHQKKAGATDKVLHEVKIDINEEEYKVAFDFRRTLSKRLEEEGDVSKYIGRKVSIENGIDPESRMIFEYIRSCVKVCWYMRIHEPPVHISFYESGINEELDVNIFRHYTRSGDKLDFVVWPPLYLHEGGPLLSKGVAQGKKMETC